MENLEAWADQLDQTTTARQGQARQICELCVRELGVSGGGISMVTPAGNRGIVCATDGISAHLEDLQFTLGEGPCIEAMATNAPVLIADFSEHTNVTVAQWPAFSEGATSRGVGAIFAFPLRLGAVSVGALDLYRGQAGSLSRSDLAAALLAADAAATALLKLDTTSRGGLAALEDGDSEGVEDAAYDLHVHQATGMVSVQAGVSMADALLLMRSRAFSTGLSLAQVAREVVQRRLRFTEENR